MAKEQTQQAETPQTTGQDGGNGSNGGGHKTAFRAVALAAASGATAIAARKAFSGRQGSGSGQENKNRGSGGGDDSLVSSMLTSGWDAAKDSLLPLAENAATSAGEFLAQSGPEVVRETLVPSFIAGFESARNSGSSDDES
jgi:hypothetical protein